MNQLADFSTNLKKSNGNKWRNRSKTFRFFAISQYLILSLFIKILLPDLVKIDKF